MSKETGDRELESLLTGWKENYYNSSAVNSEVYTSDFNMFSSSSVRASAAGRIINGGKKIVYAAATAAILNANINRYAYGFTSFVPDAATSVVNGEVLTHVQQYIKSGGTANSTVINAYAYQHISEGGVAVNTLVNSGGAQYVSIGGSSVDFVQRPGGNINISAGTSKVLISSYASGINASGQAATLSNGVANNFILYPAAYQHISSGGVANNTKISGGHQYINSGAAANNTTINSGGFQHIYMATASSTTINSGGNQGIYGGAVAKDTEVNSGGNQGINSGGSSVDFVQRSGGNITVVIGTSGALISSYASGINASGQAATLSSGVANNFILYSGGSQFFLSGGGVANNTEISSGGKQVFHRWGSSVDVLQHSGGNINVYVGTSGALISSYVSGINASGQVVTLSSGVASNFILYSDGRQDVSSGGVANNTKISGGRQDVSSGGEANSTIISSGGSQYVETGGTANSIIINSRGQQIVSTGGIANSIIVNSGGSQFIDVGGVANNTEISGGIQFVSGGVANNTEISGGSQIVYVGGIANSTTINSGGFQHVTMNGIANSTIINSNGVQKINIDGIASSTIINSGGLQNIFATGTADGTTINSGGLQNIFAAGTADGTIISSGGLQNISGGSSVNVVQRSGGYINAAVGTSGVLISSYVSGTNASGQVVTLSSGVASNFILYSGNSQHVSSGGIANNTEINSGGSQHVDRGGTANGTIIQALGSQSIVNGAANKTTINSGGLQNVYNGSIAGSTAVNSGGSQIIGWAAKSVDTINRGGEVLLYNGGVLSNYTGEAGTLNVLYDNTLKGQTLLSANAAINFGDSAKQSIAIENLHSDKGIVNMKADLETHTGDKLNITSSYDGSALISLKNTAPSAIETTGDGIKLVEFDAGASVNGTFDLLGGQWDESGYIYKLYRGDEAGAGRDYYLRSTAEYSNILATMVNTPIINNMLAMMGMNSLQKRLGDLRNFDNNENKHGIWARTYGEEMNIADLIETDMTIFSVEAGYDYLLNPNDDNKLYIGFMGGYEKSTRIKTKQENGAYNKGEGDAPSAGIYGTMIWENGWFVDLAARHFLMKLDMKNYGAAGTELSYKPKRHITTVSLEAGRAYLSNPTGKSQWRIEPKGELMYMRAWAGDTGVNNGTGDFEYDGINYISARATITAGYLRERASGLKMEPYLEAGYRYEFDGKGNIRYGGAEYQSDLSGGTLEGTIGLDWQFTKDLYGYLQGTYEKGSKIEAFGGNVGIRYGFGGGKKAAEAAGKKPEVETRAEGKEAPLSAPVELGKTITIGNAHFAFARAELSETIKAELRKKGEELKKMSYERIKIVGHADSTGTDRINNPLSERRARAVAEYLIESGAQRDKVVHWGEGSKKPAASNATKEGRALNRRVEVTVE